MRKKIWQHLKEYKSTYIFLSISILFLILSALLPLVFITDSTKADLKQWLSGLLLSLSTGLIIATFFSWRDNRKESKDEIVKEAYLINDYLNDMLYNLLIYLDAHSENFITKKIFFAVQTVPPIPNIKEKRKDLYNELRTFAENLTDLALDPAGKKKSGIITNCIDTTDSIKEKLNSLLKEL